MKKKKIFVITVLLVLPSLMFSKTKISEKDILKLKPVKILKVKRIVIGKIKRNIKLDYKFRIIPEKLIMHDEAKITIIAVDSKGKIIKNFENDDLIVYLSDMDIHNFKIKNLKMDKWGNYYIPAKSFKKGKYTFYITSDKPTPEMGILIKDGDKIYNSLDTGISLKWNYGDFCKFQFLVDKTSVKAGDKLKITLKPMDKFNNYLTNYVIKEDIILNFLPDVTTNILIISEGEYNDKPSFIFTIIPYRATTNLQIKATGEKTGKIYASFQNIKVHPLTPSEISISLYTNYSVDKTNIVYYKILDKFKNTAKGIYSLKILCKNKNLVLLDNKKNTIKSNLPLLNNSFFYFTTRKPGLYKLKLKCNNTISSIFKLKVNPGRPVKLHIKLPDVIVNNEFFKIKITFLDKYNNKSKLNDFLSITKLPDNKLEIYDNHTNQISEYFITSNSATLLLKNKNNEKTFYLTLKFSNCETNIKITPQPARFSFFKINNIEDNLFIAGDTNYISISVYNSLNQLMEYFTNEFYLAFKTNKVTLSTAADFKKIKENLFKFKFRKKDKGEIKIGIIPEKEGYLITSIKYDEFYREYTNRVLPRLYKDLKNTIVKTFYIRQDIKLKDFFNMISLPEKYSKIFMKINNITDENFVLKKGSKIEVALPVEKVNNRYVYKYRIKKDDTLYKIGVLFYNKDNWPEIFYFNNIKKVKSKQYKYVYMIYPEKYLYIPVK